jgi:hypothetical protein
MRLSRAVQEFLEDLKIGRKSYNTIRAREGDLRTFLATLPADGSARPALKKTRSAQNDGAGQKPSRPNGRRALIERIALDLADARQQQLDAAAEVRVLERLAVRLGGDA